MSGVVGVYGADMLRYRGSLNVRCIARRVVFQGVHVMMGGDLGSAWKTGETRESKIVFIGKGLPQELLLEGLAQYVDSVRSRAPRATV